MMDSTTSVPSQFTSSLRIIDSPKKHNFRKPIKKIHSNHDVQSFLTSQAYRDIGTFILQLNLSLCPKKISGGKSRCWQINSFTEFLAPVRQLQSLLERCDVLIDEFPPSNGPRRFGNISFRKWYESLEAEARDLLRNFLPKSVYESGSETKNDTSVLDELTPYFIGSFGNPQRLDYGTGHELSFFAFIAGIWKLGGFIQESHQHEDIARNIVIGIIEPYVFSC